MNHEARLHIPQNENLRGSPSTNLTFWKKLVFAIVSTIFVVFGLEVLLRVAGFEHNPHDFRQPLFVESGAGQLHTNPRYTNHPLFSPAEACHEQSLGKEAKSDTLRIVIVGGSTVWELGNAPLLRDKLQVALQRPVEVVNMGFLGCGSDRDLLSIQQAVQLDADAVLLYTGHNEFVSASNPRSDSWPVFGQQWFAVNLRFVQLIWWGLDHAGLPSPTGQIYFVRKKSYSPEEKEKVYEFFEGNVERMVQVCNDAGVDIFLSTAPSNLRMPTSTTYAVPEVKIQQLIDEVKQSGTSTLIDEPEMAFYWATYLLEELSRPDDAEVYYEDALVHHHRPERANRRINAALRNISGALKVPLIDLRQEVANHAQDGIPGSNLFRDNCHLTEEGYAIVQHAFANVLLEKYLPPR